MDILSNNENLFLVQEGEYILNRKAPEKPFALIANYDYNEQAFKLVTAVKIEKLLTKMALSVSYSWLRMMATVVLFSK